MQNDFFKLLNNFRELSEKPVLLYSFIVNNLTLNLLILEQEVYLKTYPYPIFNEIHNDIYKIKHSNYEIHKEQDTFDLNKNEIKDEFEKKIEESQFQISNGIKINLWDCLINPIFGLWDYEFICYYYKDALYDSWINIFNKQSDIKDKKNNKHEIISINKSDILKENFNSTILGFNIEQGSPVKLNKLQSFTDEDKSRSLELKINTSSNSLTIYCKNVDENFINVKIMSWLWPNLKLILEEFWWITEKGIKALRKLMPSVDNSIKSWKLLFSSVEFTKTDLNWHFNNANLKLSKSLLLQFEYNYDLKWEHLCSRPEGSRSKISRRWFNSRVSRNFVYCQQWSEWRFYH